MHDKEFVSSYGANPAKTMRCVKPWLGSGRCVILDSGLVSFKSVKCMAKHGMFAIGNVYTRPQRLPQELAKGKRPCPRAKFLRYNDIYYFYCRDLVRACRMRQGQATDGLHRHSRDDFNGKTLAKELHYYSVRWKLGREVS